MVVFQCYVSLPEGTTWDFQKFVNPGDLLEFGLMSKKMNQGLVKMSACLKIRVLQLGQNGPDSASFSWEKLKDLEEKTPKTWDCDTETNIAGWNILQ